VQATCEQHKAMQTEAGTHWKEVQKSRTYEKAPCCRLTMKKSECVPPDVVACACVRAEDHRGELMSLSVCLCCVRQ
jgi:hypothetical protein